MNNFPDKYFGTLQKHLQGEEHHFLNKDHDNLRDFGFQILARFFARVHNLHLKFRNHLFIYLFIYLFSQVIIVITENTVA